MALTPEEYLLQSKVVNGGVDENPGLTSSANPESHSKLNTTEKKSTLKAVNEIVNSKNSVATTVNNILNQSIGVVGDWVSDPALESDMKLVGDNILDAIDKMDDSIENVDSIPKVIFENTHLKVIKGRIKANDAILTNGEVRVLKDNNSFELLTDDVVYSKEAQIHNFTEFKDKYSIFYKHNNYNNTNKFTIYKVPTLSPSSATYYDIIFPFLGTNNISFKRMIKSKLFFNDAYDGIVIIDLDSDKIIQPIYKTIGDIVKGFEYKNSSTNVSISSGTLLNIIEMDGVLYFIYEKNTFVSYDDGYTINDTNDMSCYINDTFGLSDNKLVKYSKTSLTTKLQFCETNTILDLEFKSRDYSGSYGFASYLYFDKFGPSNRQLVVCLDNDTKNKPFIRIKFLDESTSHVVYIGSTSDETTFWREIYSNSTTLLGVFNNKIYFIYTKDVENVLSGSIFYIDLNNESEPQIVINEPLYNIYDNNGVTIRRGNVKIVEVENEYAFIQLTSTFLNNTDLIPFTSSETIKVNITDPTIYESYYEYNDFISLYATEPKTIYETIAPISLNRPCKNIEDFIFTNFTNQDNYLQAFIVDNDENKLPIKTRKHELFISGNKQSESTYLDKFDLLNTGIPYFQYEDTVIFKVNNNLFSIMVLNDIQGWVELYRGDIQFIIPPFNLETKYSEYYKFSFIDGEGYIKAVINNNNIIKVSLKKYTRNISLLRHMVVPVFNIVEGIKGKMSYNLKPTDLNLDLCYIVEQNENVIDHPEYNVLFRDYNSENFVFKTMLKTLNENTISFDSNTIFYVPFDSPHRVKKYNYIDASEQNQLTLDEPLKRINFLKVFVNNYFVDGYEISLLIQYNFNNSYSTLYMRTNWGILLSEFYLDHIDHEIVSISEQFILKNNIEYTDNNVSGRIFVKTVDGSIFTLCRVRRENLDYRTYFTSVKFSDGELNTIAHPFKIFHNNISAYIPLMDNSYNFQYIGYNHTVIEGSYNGIISYKFVKGVKRVVLIHTDRYGLLKTKQGQIHDDIIDFHLGNDMHDGFNYNVTILIYFEINNKEYKRLFNENIRIAVKPEVDAKGFINDKYVLSFKNYIGDIECDSKIFTTEHITDDDGSVNHLISTKNIPSFSELQFIPNLKFRLPLNYSTTISSETSRLPYVDNIIINNSRKNMKAQFHYDRDDNTYIKNLSIIFDDQNEKDSFLNVIDKFGSRIQSLYLYKNESDLSNSSSANASFDDANPLKLNLLPDHKLVARQYFDSDFRLRVSLRPHDSVDGMTVENYNIANLMKYVDAPNNLMSFIDFIEPRLTISDIKVGTFQNSPAVYEKSINTYGISVRILNDTYLFDQIHELFEFEFSINGEKVTPTILPPPNNYTMTYEFTNPAGPNIIDLNVIAKSRLTGETHTVYSEIVEDFTKLYDISDFNLDYNVASNQLMLTITPNYIDTPVYATLTIENITTGASRTIDNAILYSHNIRTIIIDEIFNYEQWKLSDQHISISIGEIYMPDEKERYQPSNHEFDIVIPKGPSIESISFEWENAKKCIVYGRFADIDKYNIAYIDSGIIYEAPIDSEGNFSITAYFESPIQFNETVFMHIGVIDQISNTPFVISSLNTPPMNYVAPIVETSAYRNSIISSDGLSFIEEDGSVQIQDININNTISLNSVYYSDDIYYNDLEATNTIIPIGDSVVLIDNSINGDTSMNDTLNLVDDITINSIEIL